MFNHTTADESPNKDVLGVEADRPDLCHKCGRCCRSATTFNPYPRLKELVAEGHQGAIDFLEIFEPYASIEEARKVVPDQVDQVLREVKRRQDMKVEDVTFYHCKYVTEEGLCGIYERRPECCKQAPYSGWAVMPPNCGFEGWQFALRESHVASIRKLKEMQFQMEMLSPDGVMMPVRNMTLDELRESVTQRIQPWAVYGAERW